jgi:hypothetical protein
LPAEHLDWWRSESTARTYVSRRRLVASGVGPGFEDERVSGEQWHTAKRRALVKRVDWPRGGSTARTYVSRRRLVASDVGPGLEDERVAGEQWHTAKRRAPAINRLSRITYLSS